MITRPKPLVAHPRPRFIPSGSTVLDLALGGGWACGRIINVVGDKSTNKTGVAIEACANFGPIYGSENIRYRERESAFDFEYAVSLGLPRDIKFSDDPTFRTVEDFHDDVSAWLDKREAGTPSLYILDTMDALSDEVEMKKEFGKQDYGRKAGKLGEFFRKRLPDLAAKSCTLMIISQIRDNIGVVFGETKTRACEHPLDFYSSQIVWLYKAGDIPREVLGVKRNTGIIVRAHVKKNKMAPPFRESKIHVIFNYGIADEDSMVDWLKENKADEKQLSVSFDTMGQRIRRARRAGDRPALQACAEELKNLCFLRWAEIEDALAPALRKYE